jgi:hypothetical protein
LGFTAFLPFPHSTYRISLFLDGQDARPPVTSPFPSPTFHSNIRANCILFKIHGKPLVALGVRRHVAAFIVGNKLPTNAAGSKAQACNVFPKKSGRALNPPRTQLRLFLV